MQASSYISSYTANILQICAPEPMAYFNPKPHVRKHCFQGLKPGMWVSTSFVSGHVGKEPMEKRAFTSIACMQHYPRCYLYLPLSISPYAMTFKPCTNFESSWEI
jgi:hypothetical protein